MFQKRCLGCRNGRDCTVSAPDYRILPYLRMSLAVSHRSGSSITRVPGSDAGFGKREERRQ